MCPCTQTWSHMCAHAYPPVHIHPYPRKSVPFYFQIKLDPEELIIIWNFYISNLRHEFLNLMEKQGNYTFWQMHWRRYAKKAKITTLGIWTNPIAFTVTGDHQQTPIWRAYVCMCVYSTKCHTEQHTHVTTTVLHNMHSCIPIAGKQIHPW